MLRFSSNEIYTCHFLITIETINEILITKFLTTLRTVIIILSHQEP